MTASRKIAEAEGILAKIQEKPSDDFESQFDIFVKTVHDILNHLLEEYSAKFGCKTDGSGFQKFKSKAKKTGNVDAINFLIWYEKEYRKVREDPLCGYLLENDYELPDRVDALKAGSALLSQIRSLAYQAYENF